ncbi:MAG: hypothetical protein ABIT83_06620 [Massilia sp.]
MKPFAAGAFSNLVLDVVLAAQPGPCALWPAAAAIVATAGVCKR